MHAHDARCRTSTWRKPAGLSVDMQLSSLGVATDVDVLGLGAGVEPRAMSVRMSAARCEGYTRTHGLQIHVPLSRTSPRATVLW